MASFTNFIDTITKPFSGLFSSAPSVTVPFSPIPGDVISIFFSLLDERSKANLGKACKILNATYLDISPIGFGSKLLYTNLDDVAVELAKATKERPQIAREYYSRLSLPSMYRSPEPQGNDLELVMKADDKLSKFYNKFRKILGILDTPPGPESSGFFAVLANQMIKSSFETAHVDAAKLVTVTKEFNETYLDDLCELYTRQPFDSLTIESFKAEVAAIKEWFGDLDTIEIETTLRKAIRYKAPTELENIRQEYLNPAADAPRFVAVRAALEAKLIAEKNALQAELEVLLGSNGFNGTVHAAFQERQQAEAEKSQARIAFVTAVQQSADGLNENEILTFIDFVEAASTGSAITARVQELLTIYRQKAKAFEKKDTAYNALAERLTEIAQFTGTNLTGGKLHTIEATLQPAALDIAARAEATKRAAFYRELKNHVSKDNQAQRSNALHAIID